MIITLTIQSPKLINLTKEELEFTIGYSIQTDINNMNYFQLFNYEFEFYNFESLNQFIQIQTDKKLYQIY